jgi:DNA-binding beta-propeller fold protein YncE
VSDATPVAPDEATPREPDGPAPAPIRPLADAGAASAGAVALARLGPRSLAFIADADDRAIVTFDVDAREAIASTPLGARPSALLVTPAGRVVALGADDARVHVLALVSESGKLVPERAIDVAEEPVSAALAPDGDTLLVASRWGHALGVVPLSGNAEAVRIDLPRDPTAVVPSADGRHAVVAHAVGSRVSVVDLESRAVRSIPLDRRFDPRLSWNRTPMPSKMERLPIEAIDQRAGQSFSLARAGDGRILVPEVLVDTGSTGRSSGYGAPAAAATAAVAVVADDAKRPQTLAVGATRCLLPRGAALDGAGGRLLVACAGTDEIVAFAIGRGLASDARVRVDPGPVAIAVDGEERRALVWSEIDRSLSALDVGAGTNVAWIALVPRSAPAPSTEVLRGRALFHHNFDRRVSDDGRACANCHIDGRDDGVAWSSPGGRRQTPMLLERLDGTAPYGWDGRAADLERHVHQTTLRLGGSGLGAGDIADLAAYLGSLRAPRSARPADASLLARGAALFHSGETECASCHAGPPLTDGLQHDVQSAARSDRRDPFDTPSLHLVAHSAPYFHDGRYATLGDVLAGSDGTMGHTSQLSADDRTALLAYLTTL